MQSLFKRIVLGLFIWFFLHSPTILQKTARKGHLPLPASENSRRPRLCFAAWLHKPLPLP